MSNKRLAALGKFSNNEIFLTGPQYILPCQVLEEYSKFGC